MILEHGNDPVSARWDKETNQWNVGERKKYRWNTPEDKPASDWFYDIREALDWIIDYDSKKAAI